MILFLDDSPERAALAHQRMTPEDRNKTIWCKAADEAISVLKDYAEVLEKVCLDHDLGGQQFQNSYAKNCGMEVIRYLESLGPEEKAKLDKVDFIVHSWNPGAAKEMAIRIFELGLKVIYRPFGT